MGSQTARSPAPASPFVRQIMTQVEGLFRVILIAYVLLSFAFGLKILSLYSSRNFLLSLSIHTLMLIHLHCYFGTLSMGHVQRLAFSFVLSKLYLYGIIYVSMLAVISLL